MSKIWDSFRQETLARADMKRVTSLLAGFVVPTLIALWVGLKSDWAGTQPFAFWSVLGLMGMAQAVFGAFSMRSRFLAAELFIEHRDNEAAWQESLAEARKVWARLEERVKALSGSIEEMSRLAEAGKTWTTMLHIYILRGIESDRALRECIDEVLQPVLSNIQKIFNFQDEELWNFGVYIWDEQSDMLVPLCRKRCPGHPSKAEGRRWRSGQGHVGQAFAGGETLITSDATDPSVAGFLKLSDDMRKPYDDRAYVSLVSIPIVSAHEVDRPMGILVATSNIKDRFNRRNCLILDQAAEVLAVTMSVYHISSSTRERVDGLPVTPEAEND